MFDFEDLDLVFLTLNQGGEVLKRNWSGGVFTTPHMIYCFLRTLVEVNNNIDKLKQLFIYFF